MEKYILNETPVRTANNFGINNIEMTLENPEYYKEFDNFSIEAEDINNIQLEINNNEEKIVEEDNRIGLKRNINYRVKIIIPENVKIKDNIKLEFELDDENEFLIENIEIILEKMHWQI